MITLQVNGKQYQLEAEPAVANAVFAATGKAVTASAGINTP